MTAGDIVIEICAYTRAAGGLGPGLDMIVERAENP